VLLEGKETFLQSTPSPSSFKGLGDVCGELGEWAEAYTWYAKVVHTEPWSSLARFDLGRALIALNRTATAPVVCETAIRLDPQDSAAWNLLGTCRLKDDFYVAQHCFIRSLQLVPSSLALPWLNLAWTLAQAKEKVALARRGFSQAQTIEPDSCAAWLGHSQCATVTGDQEEKLRRVAALEW
jgi:tetratricopeptide (TPR) repeat protein